MRPDGGKRKRSKQDIGGGSRSGDDEDIGGADDGDRDSRLPPYDRDEARFAVFEILDESLKSEYSLYCLI